MKSPAMKLIVCVFVVASLLMVCDYQFKGKRLKDILTVQFQNYQRKGGR